LFFVGLIADQTALVHARLQEVYDDRR